MEHLRLVARSGSGDPDVVAGEAAEALLTAVADPAELVVACRRLLDRHPAAGPLWWVASLALTDPDPRSALLAALTELRHDGTQRQAAAFRREHPDERTVTAWAFSADGALLPPDALAPGRGGFDDAGAGHPAVWIVGGVGRGLPGPVFEAARRRSEAAAPGRRPTCLSAADVAGVIGPRGPSTLDAALASSRCPVAPELLRSPSN